ncbi:MAG: DNA polymerase/3'-5' exonuclease PolX [Acidobacteriota bacterium]
MDGGNEALAALFKEMAELTILEEGSPNSFRVRAYENAVEAITGHSGTLASLSERDLTAIAGIGKSTAKKIREFYDTGGIAKLEELRGRYPADFVALTRIPGVGPKTVLRLRSDLRIENVDDLRAAIEGKKLRELKGLGAKMEEKLLHAIERMGARGKDQRIPIADAMPIARELVAALEALPSVVRARYCGSLRRLRETIADVDVVAASEEPGAVREAFLAMPSVREVIGSGGTKTSVLTSTGLQVDLRVVPPKSFGAASQYFTGSKAHNVKLRQRALSRGWTLNEYGLTDLETGKTIASETEEAIYEALGLPCIPPPMREDRGEIELAAAGKLPAVVRLEDLRGDLHVHTSLSADARSPLDEVVGCARARGYAYLAITDHAEKLAMNGATREELLEQRARIQAMRGPGAGIELLHGVELNIDRDGGVDYDPEFRRSLDWCIAGVHSHFELDRDQQTRRIIAAMEDPTVDAIAHLTGRRIGSRDGIDLDVDAVLRKAVETNTAIEINAALPRLDVASDILFRARDLPITWIIDTDTHHVRELERMEWGALQAARGWIDPARVANTWPLDRFLGWLHARRAA